MCDAGILRLSGGDVRGGRVLDECTLGACGGEGAGGGGGLII